MAGARAGALGRGEEKEIIFGDHYFEAFLQPLWTNLSQSYPHIAGLANFHENANYGKREPLLPTDRQLWDDFNDVLEKDIEDTKVAMGAQLFFPDLGTYLAKVKELKDCRDALAKMPWDATEVGKLKADLDKLEAELLVIKASPAYEQYVELKAIMERHVAQLQELKERNAELNPLTVERNLQWGLVIEAQTKLLKKYLSVVGETLATEERKKRMGRLLEELDQLGRLENPYLNVTTTSAYLGLENFQDAIARQDRPGLMRSDDWPVVSRVSAAAAANANYVIMRDHLGNWQIKSASNDPRELINAASNGVLAATALVASGKSVSKQFNKSFSAFAKEYQGETAGVQGLVELVKSLTVEREGLMKAIGEAEEALAKAKESKDKDAIEKAELAQATALKKAAEDLPQIRKLLEQIDKTLTSDLKTQAELDAAEEAKKAAALADLD